MASYLSSLPPLADFFPPTPRAFQFISNAMRLFPLFTILQWTPLGGTQAMGKTSIISRFNLPGRYAWAAAESVGPLNLIYILYTLPLKLKPQPAASTSFLGTGLSAQQEILGALYVIHYINRAIITPFMAPSMSPIHPSISIMMAIFQFMNSSNLAGWIIYTNPNYSTTSTVLTSVLAILGLITFAVGMGGNIAAEHQLFSLRRGAAKRKAKSEGRAQVTYDKVYVIPPAEGLFKAMLYPHYFLEWVEWAGYWILGGAWGFGWGYGSAGLVFLINELASMSPRAVSGKHWYEGKFGKRAVAGRAAVFPGLGL